MTSSKHKADSLRRHLVFLMAKAARDYGMIDQGDRVMVCHSGGKDSFALLDILLAFRRQSPVKFDVIAVGVDQNFPGFPRQVLPDYFTTLGIEFHIIEQDIYGTIKAKIPPGKTMCGLCSRLRRGALYRFAEEHHMQKIALGHHRDDIVETLFLNLFYGGKMKAMPPKLLTDSKKNVVIRPMAYMAEEDLSRYARLMEFPVIPGNLCGASESTQRQVVKAMLKTWKKEFPGRIEKIFNSLQNIEPSQLADMNLFDFKHLSV
ncbi:MAG: tRNA 2-thiocytidine(32) synthetase TtcA [Proteobacteria bacterium]|nr:tRNA 2-thiocytidine(32) synthetase TtcA [Pseudomonadota bacterium]